MTVQTVGSVILAILGFVAIVFLLLAPFKLYAIARHTKRTIQLLEQTNQLLESIVLQTNKGAEVRKAGAE